MGIILLSVQTLKNVFRDMLIADHFKIQSIFCLGHFFVISQFQLKYYKTSSPFIFQ